MLADMSHLVGASVLWNSGCIVGSSSIRNPVVLDWLFLNTSSFHKALMS